MGIRVHVVLACIVAGVSLFGDCKPRNAGGQDSAVKSRSGGASYDSSQKLYKLLKAAGIDGDKDDRISLVVKCIPFIAGHGSKIQVTEKHAFRRQATVMSIA